MQKVISFLIIALCSLAVLGCSDREKDTDEQDIRYFLRGEWKQISGYEVDVGCEVLHTYHVSGSMDFSNWDPEQASTTKEIVSGKYYGTPEEGRYNVRFEFFGDNDNIGCNGKTTELVGKEGLAYFEFIENSIGAILQFDVYESATGGTAYARFERQPQL